MTSDTPPDLPQGPDSPPSDELASAEASLRVLQNVVHPIANDDWSKRTPCTEFDIEKLTDHLMNSITIIGGAAGAELPERNARDSVERQVIAAARPALDAWHRRGLDGTVKFGDNEAPARVMAGILSLEFLVHAWDYAKAVGRVPNATDSLSQFVLGLAQKIITPQGRTTAGFDDPVDIPADANALERLVAYTGRDPNA
ncbi:TIGR03086 family protein [Mycobacteriaceae bacterium 1482268.1]|nr:TIGR03086 family protein [Mycobacteriaceae bacterium 1482268.1]